MRAAIIDYGCDNVPEWFDTLYENSAFTWEGLLLENEDDAAEIAEHFESCGHIDEAVGTLVFFRTKGADMNERYGLTGANAYRDDLTIVSIINSFLNIGDMLPIQYRFGAKWFDDIVDNNSRRERELSGRDFQ